MDYKEKFDTCRLLSLPSCPNVEKMKTIFLQEMKPGQDTKFWGEKEYDEDAQLCKDCDKYEKEGEQ